MAVALLAVMSAGPSRAAPASLPSASETSPRNHIQAQLLSDGPAIPGEALTLALLFSPEPGWHGYWKNPGDAGFGMLLDWNLPNGWRAGEPQYPVPGKLLISGLMNHVYEGEYAVLVQVEVPAGEAPGRVLPVALKAEWLACTDAICVPERGTFTLRLPLSSMADTAAGDARFDRWRAAIPPMIDAAAHFALAPQALRLAIPLPASLDVRSPHVFIAEDQLVDYAAPQAFRRSGDMLVAEIPRGGLGQGAGTVSGVLAFDGASGAVRFEARPGEVPAGGAVVGTGGSGAGSSVWLLLGGALIGGLLLNLMPCVFPILSLKALTLARAGESEAQARREGLAYTAGVVLACLALGGLLLALRAAGSEIGWAFQLQEPGVVVALLALAVAITANFAGLFELPSLSITRTGGPTSAFATGLLAAFVATPCTGPFMAAALGAALLLPWEQALLLFAALGLGLALPFLLLGFVPPLRRLLPAPGRWMERFRRIMAVPMGLTALALLWLCWRMGGAAYLAAIAICMAGLVALLVLLGRSRRSRDGRNLLPALGAAAAVLVAIIAVPAPSPDARPGDESVLEPIGFSPEALAEARTSGRPVFLWFTADWCLTCKVNENVAIEREATREAFDKAGVVAMRGDWTLRDPQITRFLTEQGAAGVPLYIWYPAAPASGAAGEQGVILPQVLGRSSLVELARAE